MSKSSATKKWQGKWCQRQRRSTLPQDSSAFAEVAKLPQRKARDRNGKESKIYTATNGKEESDDEESA